jgi:hypothetical protein
MSYIYLSGFCICVLWLVFDIIEYDLANVVSILIVLLFNVLIVQGIITITVLFFMGLNLIMP